MAGKHTLPSTLPVISIDPTRPSSEVAAELDDACRRWGFFQITGHGLPNHVIASMHAATSAFFALPLTGKQECRPPSADVNRGYASRGSESLAYSLAIARPPDLFEAFNIGPDVVWRIIVRPNIAFYADIMIVLVIIMIMIIFILLMLAALFD